MAGRHDWPGDRLVMAAQVDRSPVPRPSEQVPVPLDRAAGVRRSPPLARFYRALRFLPLPHDLVQFQGKRESSAAVCWGLGRFGFGCHGWERHRHCWDVVTETDLEHLVNLIGGRDGEMEWQSLMERSTPSMAYKAWRHDPETGPTVYCSRTVFEDATPELVRDFFWDDEFRPKWDPMLTYFKILGECPQTGTMIVHWIKKFPFFCSDREYLIGRRIWVAGKTYYCVTKGVPYPGLPKCDKPRRVEHYFSSWIIKAVESQKGDGQLSACEVTLVHYEDMGIPKDVAKLGVRHGMWCTVKKLHSGMRAYQNARKSEAALSQSAQMAKITTQVSSDGSMNHLEPSPGEEEKGQIPNNKRPNENGIDWKWIVIGGSVALVCGLHTGVIGKGLLLGAGQRFARKR
nr:uncharacterized protein LOC103425717 isoform X2 [Malus domestica]